MKSSTTKEENSFRRLFRLEELNDYEVSDKETDVRGFIVLGGDGDKIGKVNELIVDPETAKVRYLEVKLSNELVLIDDHNHVIVPIGLARLDSDHDHVIVDNLNRSNIKFYPPYHREPITREYEQRLRDSHRYTMMGNNISGSSAPIQSNPQHEGEGPFSSTSDPGDHVTSLSGSENKDIDFYKSEIEVLKKERDIARAERDILKLQLRQAKGGVKDDFYDHDDFDADKFYESRRRRNLD